MGLEIQSANARKLRVVEVFAHALRFFKDHCLQELSDQSSTRIVNDDIRWVITVPAIWRQPAKQFMRQAAYKVGSGGYSGVCICHCKAYTFILRLQNSIYLPHLLPPHNTHTHTYRLV